MIWLAAALVLALALGAAYGAGYAVWARGRAPKEGRMVATAAGPVHIIERGRADGPARVLIHGAASNARDILFALEAELGRDGRLIAIDRPGFGDSPAFGSSERLKGHADAVAAVIAALKLEKSVVVAHSYGGSVALRLALDHPDAASGFVLAAPPSYGFVGPAAWYNYAADIPVAGFFFSHIVAPIVGPRAIKTAIPATFAPQPAPEGYADKTGIVLFFRPATFRANARDLARVNRELAAQEARYGEIALPVALIAGEADKTVSTTRHSVRLASVLKDARLTLLPGVGHMPHYADPGLVGEHVRAIEAGRR